MSIKWPDSDKKICLRRIKSMTGIETADGCLRKLENGRF